MGDTRRGRACRSTTVHQKLAIAENHRADFLLFITTSNFSPDCRDEVDRHNARGGSAQIRVWPYFVVENLLTVHGQVALKYGLRGKVKRLGRIELLAAFAELLSARAQDAEKFGQFVRARFRPNSDSYDWCVPHPLPTNDFDQTSLRAALAGIRTITGQDRVDCTFLDKRHIELKNVANLESLQTSKLFALIETFGLITCSYNQSDIVLEARADDDQA